MIDQVRGIGRDPALLVETLSGARAEAKARIKELEAEKSGLERDLKRHNAQMRELAREIGSGSATTDRMADLLDRVRGAEERLAQVRDELARLGRDLLDEDEAIRALAAFDPVWETLTLREQARVLQLLIQRVDYDGDKGTVSVTFHPAGIETLSREYADSVTEKMVRPISAVPAWRLQRERCDVKAMIRSDSGGATNSGRIDHSKVNSDAFHHQEPRTPKGETAAAATAAIEATATSFTHFTIFAPSRGENDRG
ncbi:MAG: hypothetical protein R6X25_09925 [Candidatus Krumholzibacteriia bacterium]